MLDVETVLIRLEQEGYRLTSPRRALLEEVLSRSAPFTSAELWETIQANAPTIGRATVFRTLDLLNRMGIVQRIHQDAEGGPCNAYVACGQSHHHHHLICNGCGAVADFTEDKAFHALVKEIEKRTAFQIEGHRIELVGRCATCQSLGGA
jgi:Fur family transcriptional regulator, ferric uptake regulator